MCSASGTSCDCAPVCTPGQPGVCSGPKSMNICVQLPGECPKFITLACAGGCVNDVCDFGGFPIP